MFVDSCGKLHHKGYVYTKNRSTETATYYRCSKREKCSATFIVYKNGDISERKEHTHLPQVEEETVTMLLEQLKKKVTTTSVPIPTLYNETLVEVQLQGVSSHFPTFESVRSSLYKRRSDNFPRYSRNSCELEVAGNFARTLSNEPFLMIDRVYTLRGVEKRLLVFSTKQNLQTLSECDVWAMDGTFKSCPSSFSQFFNVLGFVQGKAFPLVFSLLSGKDRFTYEILIQDLKIKASEMEIELHPSVILKDYERCVTVVLRAHFPNSSIQGCLFHYTHCIFRWIKDNGLVHDYREREILSENSLDKSWLFHFCQFVKFETSLLSSWTDSEMMLLMMKPLTICLKYVTDFEATSQGNGYNTMTCFASLMCLELLNEQTMQLKVGIIT